MIILVMSINWNTKTEFITSVFEKKQMIKETLPELAFVGKSNVGKSSVINKILNRKNLVKTS